MVRIMMMLLMITFDMILMRIVNKDTARLYNPSPGERKSLYQHRVCIFGSGWGFVFLAVVLFTRSYYGVPAVTFMILWCTRGYDSASKKTPCSSIHDGINAEAKNSIRDACAFERLNDSVYMG